MPNPNKILTVLPALRRTERNIVSLKALLLITVALLVRPDSARAQESAQGSDQAPDPATTVVVKGAKKP